MRKEKVTFKSLGYKLVGIIEYPENAPAPGVILCHGLSNTKDDCPLIKETSEMLASRGFITFRFDYFGSGESPGIMVDKTISVLEQNTKDALDFLSSLKNIVKIGIWGRSFGGTLVGLCGYDKRIKASVIASGVFYLDKVFERKKMKELIKKEKEMEKKGKRLAGTGHYKGKYGLGEKLYEELGRYSYFLKDKLEMMKNVMVLGTVPDEKVPSENSMAIYNTVKDSKEIHIFGNTNHKYEGVESEVLSLVRRWFTLHLGE